MLTHQQVERHLYLAAVQLMGHGSRRSAATIVGKHDRPSLLYKPAQESARDEALFQPIPGLTRSMLNLRVSSRPMAALGSGVQQALPWAPNVRVKPAPTA